MWYLYTVEFYSATKNKILSFTGKSTELENSVLSEIIQAQKAKATCSPSYADCRPKTNAAILRDEGPTKGRLHRVGIGQGIVEHINLNVVDVLKKQE
jgi:hypothetical protein